MGSRSFRSIARALVPSIVLENYRRHRTARLHRQNQQLTTEQVFTRIYAQHEWGGQPGTFCSGSGSELQALVSPYVERMLRELQRLGARSLTAVDLGCGDFRVGRHLASACGHYIGIDIVRPLVERNREQFGSDRIRFEHRNIVEDPLPPGDICFVRQVFQHLSNAQIAAVLPKLAQYRYWFVTEHHPSPECLRAPNRDKPHGPDVRVNYGSGVFLDHPPFSLPRERCALMLELKNTAPAVAGIDPGMIRTYLIQQ